MKLKEILKKYWILLLIVILAIGGLGTFFVIKNNKKENINKTINWIKNL